MIRRLLLLCAATACLDLNAPSLPTVHGDGERILFVGNSLTGYVPELVQSMAASRGKSIGFAMMVQGNYALIDHWNDGLVQRAIREGGYDVVVLQQGPSSTAINRDSLRLVTKLFAQAAEASGARVALYAAWPASDRLQDIDRAAESYRLAATDVGGLLFPVSTAWKLTLAADPSIALYSDGLHASPAGNYLAALVIYAALFGDTPKGLPASVPVRGGSVTMPVETLTVLQDAAAKAVPQPQ